MTPTTTELVEESASRDRLGRKLLPRARREALLADYDRSGLSQAAFARRAGVAYPTFAHWVQQRRRSQPSAGSAMPNSAPPQRLTANIVPPRFVELALPPLAPSPLLSPPGWELSVTLPDGVVLRGAEPAALAVLVRALREGTRT
jgi:transposase-like protein